MKIDDILKPKSLSAIREEVPNRYRYAMIGEQLYDLYSGNLFRTFSNTAEDISTEGLYKKIIGAFRSGDEIITWNEIYFGGFHYRDFIILNELFSPIQKWDVSFCTSIFNGESQIFQLQIVNIATEEYYMFFTNDLSYKDRFLSETRDLELVKLHLGFETLGGKYESPSRFIDLVERAGWENGVKMITAINSVITMLQSTGKLGREEIMTRVSDHVQSDDHYIVYKFSPGTEGYHLITYHYIEEDTTKVRIFKGDIEEYAAEVFDW